MRQLRRTCDALTANGIDASAVVVACDENLDTARALGFGTVERDNDFLSRRYNDSIQIACDPTWNRRPVDFVVPCGSDDFVDHRIFLDLPPADTVLGFQHLSFVREDGREISSAKANYTGGCGIRVYPRHVMARLGYRPADEDRVRACDTSILTNLRKAYPLLRIVHAETDARSIVDWKTFGEQLNSYDAVRIWKRAHGPDPFQALAGVFPDESLRDMQAHYARARRRPLVAA